VLGGVDPLAFPAFITRRNFHVISGGEECAVWAWPLRKPEDFGCYAKAKLMPPERRKSEEWVCNRFGRRLYEIFFKTYTEKVWGVPCTTIRAEWAAQRIKGLSLLTAVRNALLPSKKSNVKTLIDKFQYPERGPGQMWETLTDQLNANGYPVLMQRPVVRICHQDDSVTRLITAGPQGRDQFAGTDFISSMPIRDLVNALDPAPPQRILDAANKLRYRDFRSSARSRSKRSRSRQPDLCTSRV
jgi:protoporphyrinogen oxidase